MAPLYARRLLGVGPEGLGGMLTAVGLGAVATALVMASRGDFGKKGFGVLLASSGFVVALAGFAPLAQLPAVARVPRAARRLDDLDGLARQHPDPEERARPDARPRPLALRGGLARAWSRSGRSRPGAVAERFGARASLLAGAVVIAVTLVVVRLVRPLPSAAE